MRWASRFAGERMFPGLDTSLYDGVAVPVKRGEPPAIHTAAGIAAFTG